MVRSYDEEMRFIRKVGPCRFEIAKGFVPNMKVRCDDVMIEEDECSCVHVFVACVCGCVEGSGHVLRE